MSGIVVSDALRTSTTSPDALRLLPYLGAADVSAAASAFEPGEEQWFLDLLRWGALRGWVVHATPVAAEREAATPMPADRELKAGDPDLGGPRLPMIRDYRPVGRYIRQMRAERGLSIEQLAEQLADASDARPVSTDYLGALEAGLAAAHPEHLPLFEERLGTPPGELHHLYGYLTAAEANAQRTSRTMSREEWLASDEFEDALTEHFTRAATAAVADHHRAGRSVHARAGGKLVEILPPHKHR